MQNYFADLHIHIGRTKTGKPVKITASRNLTLTNILYHAKNKKGIDLVGVIDCHSPEVLEEIEDLINAGRLEELNGGGLLFEKTTTLLLGSELEIYDDRCLGPIHILAFIPTLERMREFSRWLATKMKNVQLSSQRIYTTGRALQEKVRELDGLFIPAHVFTPFKSLFGKGVHRSLEEVFDPELIDGVELGLSSDTYMVEKITELDRYPFITNSDAHSLAKIAREYQRIRLKTGDFLELKKALKGEDGRGIVANYGLDPKLGKYYRTTCQKCFTAIGPLTERCPNCGSKQIVKGVSERIKELADENTLPPARPPYIHQVPLEFLPGIGPKTFNKLLDHFQTEMNILHRVSFEELVQAIPEKIATLIMKVRSGELKLEAGGGGRYGKVASEQE